MPSFWTILKNTRQALQSVWFLLLVFIGAAWVVVAQAPIAGTAGFVLLICVLLLLSDNTAVTLLPFSLICMFVLKEYDSFDRFIKLWWLAIPVTLSLLFHLVAYREKTQSGILLYALAGVAIAITFGGLGSITSAEYFTGANLYYVAGLGVGMIMMHLLVTAKYHDRDRFHVSEYVCLVFYLIGLFAVFMLVQHFAVHWQQIKISGELPQIQWSNNLSTFLMIALPFGFYFSQKNALHMVSTIMMLMAMLLSGSRAPLIFGVLEYVLCVVVFCVIDYKHCYVYLVPFAVLVGVVVKWYQPIQEYFTEVLSLENLENEARYQMALRAWGELRSNPLFGSGLGATSRQDIYNPVKFAMNWYHSAPFQIVGSLGIAGILTYSSLWSSRAVVSFKNRSVFGYTVMLSQVGLFLMSLVNPGFFCPFPYEFFMVMLFAVLARKTSASE